MRPPDARHRRPPDDLIWWIATVSLVLPWIGGALAFVGVFRIAHGDYSGAWFAAGGAALVVIDLLSDIWLHRIAITSCEEPGLNLRGARDVGRVVVLGEPIVAGRGRVRLGDTFWMVEGEDAPAGTRVRIVGRRSSVLLVEPDTAARGEDG